MSAPQRPADPQSTLAGYAQPSVTIAAGSAIGSWTVERNLGAGAMGEVFLAHREQDRAAVKVVAKRFASDDAFIQRFQREIVVLSKLDHPHVARALDWGSLGGRPWLAMEYVDGPSLDALLDKHGPFFESDVLKLAVQLARGLEHIHQRAGLIHRDVKPANILIARARGGNPQRLLNPGDAAKIIDFGLAKPVEQGEDHGLTMTGMIMGTPNYIAPEQVACERNLTLHVDMYALGATVYHLLTGKVPFQAGSAAAVMAAHLNQAPPDPGQVVPAISQSTRQLVLTTLAKRAADRFSDWNAFVVACEKALAGLGEGGSASTNRFLKKPMVKPPTTTVARAAPPPAAVPTTAVTRAKPSGQRPGSGTSAPSPSFGVSGGGALEVRPGTTAAVVESLVGSGDGSSALRAAVTSKIIRVQTSARHRRDASPTSATKKHGQTSAVHKWSGRLEVAGATGGAVLPWVALGAATLLAVAGAAYALMR